MKAEQTRCPQEAESVWGGTGLEATGAAIRHRSSRPSDGIGGRLRGQSLHRGIQISAVDTSVRPAVLTSPGLQVVGDALGDQPIGSRAEGHRRALIQHLHAMSNEWRAHVNVLAGVGCQLKFTRRGFIPIVL
jgi:hypothetical protein